MTLRLGIEISTTAVRVVVLNGGNSPELVSLSSVALPHGVVRDGVLVDIDAAVVALRACLQQVAIRRRRVVPPTAWVSIAGLRAITREIDLPAVPEAELDAAIHLQALDVLPFPFEDAIVSSRRVHRSGTDGSAGRVLLVAAHRELVEPVVEAVERAGIRVTGVDLGAAALVRSLRSVGTLGAEAIVSIGAELTTVVVQEAGELRFVRTVSSGAAAVTRAISRKLDVPFDDAEQLKLALPKPFDSLDAIRPEMLMALRDGATDLLSEIRTSLDYYAALPRAAELTALVVTGGGSRLPGLLDRIRLQVRVPVTAGDSFANLSSLGHHEPDAALTASFAVALGTALAADAAGTPIDLLPRERRDRHRAERAERSVLIGAAALLGLCGIFGALRQVEVFSAEHTASSLASANSGLAAQFPGYATVAHEHAEVASDASLVAPIVTDEVNWPAVLVALKASTPGSIGSTGFDGAATGAGNPGAVTTAASSARPTSSIGTVNLSLTGSGYPAFQQWFSAMTRSGAFQIIQYSGVSSSSASVQFTAELGVTKAIHSTRSSQFEEPRP